VSNELIISTLNPWRFTDVKISRWVRQLFA